MRDAGEKSGRTRFSYRTTFHPTSVSVSTLSTATADQELPSETDGILREHREPEYAFNAPVEQQADALEQGSRLIRMKGELDTVVVDDS